MGFHWYVELHPPGTKCTQNEAQSMVGEVYSTTTLHSDQPIHGIAPECRVHNPGVKNAQNELHWYLTTKCCDPIFQ